MKRFHSLIVIAITITATVAASCASTGNSARSERQSSERLSRVQVENPNISLADYLRRVPGVNVQGSGNNVQIIIRGINTFRGSTAPLFYIDQTRVGRSYSRVNSMVNMHDVDNIKVVKGVEASAYGVEGANGVIIINTKRSG
ncbi:TonB-dependent receptor plug domain-containing protein [Halalkalibaculum sp. DA3122]|uniref:TonB-dependent receptor plug domain-containing protein n=1 Tax=Halalkalibaculum sp. DA3122 TaxID=3373607 RepID=UPI003753F547